jgi:hypothetical protein
MVRSVTAGLTPKRASSYETRYEVDESTGSTDKTRWKLEKPGVDDAAVGAMLDSPLHRVQNTDRSPPLLEWKSNRGFVELYVKPEY